MTTEEAAVLLAHLAELDRRKYDAMTARAWAWALAEVPLDTALDMSLAAYDRGVKYIDVATLREMWAERKARARMDYNGAKQRGLVPEGWPKDRPLPPDTQIELARLRKAEWEATNDDPATIGQPAAVTGTFGVHLKSIEDA